MRWFIVLLVASVNFACGSRSGLPGFESELGGTGGSVHTGGSGGVGGSGGNGGNGGNGGKGGNGRNGGHGGHGGDGGTGAVGAAAGSGGVGGIAECSETLLEGIAGVVGSSKHDEFDPALAASTDNGSRVTLMFRWRALSAIEPIGLPPPKLGHLDFDAWEASWPASLGQAWVAQSYGSGGSFALGDAPGDAHAFLFHDDGFTTGFIGAAFAPSAVPKGVSPQVAQLLPVPSRSLFVVRGQFDQLVGFEETIAPLNRLVYGRYQDGKFFAFKDSGCTNNLPIAASAVRVPSAYLVALYSLSPFGAACTFAGGNEMQLVRFDDGGWPKLVWKIGTDTGVRQLALVRTTNRIWFLHQAELGGAAINAIALDTTGTQLESVGPVVPSNTTNGPFAATAIGSRLVIAYPNFNKTSVHIDVFAPSGAKSFSITPSGPAPPPYGILGAPGGNRLLVAWAATNASGEKRVQVARYCFPAE